MAQILRFTLYVLNNLKPVITLLIIVGSLLFVSACQTATPATPVSSPPAVTLSPTLVVSTPLATDTNTPVPPSATPTPTPLPTATPQPGAQTEQLLHQSQLPIRNPEDLARRFKDASPSGPQPGKDYALGDTESFWVLDSGANPPRQFQITARLQYITDHSYWWVEEGFSVADKDLQASAQIFEEQTYPGNRAFFGQEASPGVDDDVRVHLLLGNIPGVAGYFYSTNQYPQWAVESSNQHEMFIINLKAIKPGNKGFDGVMAHEFQHMIHWNQDPNEDAWINEGLAELAEFINGYGVSGFSGSYLQKPDIPLTSWSSDPAIRSANYGGGFLFTLYLYDRFGAEAIKTLVSNADNGIAGVEKTLMALGFNDSFDDVFADFIIANYLNDTALEEGQWGYNLLDEDLPAIKFEQSLSDFPAEINSAVHQYGVDYLKIKTTQPLSLHFSGAITTPLLNTSPPSGSHFWYSNRADTLDATLSRAFDLRNVNEATLQFSTWYDIEPDWDYAYVTVSADGGQSWDILPGKHTVSSNPSANAYGPGFTGKSNKDGGWVQETIDLSPYAGQEILLRFEYITDDAVNRPGFALDDILIPQINYSYNAENGLDDWDANGFILTDNILPQKYILQLIQLETEDGPIVEPMSLSEDNIVTFNLSEPGEAVLIISAQAPVTTIPAPYNLKITPDIP